MDMEPDCRFANPREGTHRGGMLRPSMHTIKPQATMVPCHVPQHPKTPPQPIMSHRCRFHASDSCILTAQVKYAVPAVHMAQPQLVLRCASVSALLGGFQHAADSSQSSLACCRAWESPFRASPPESDSSLFSCHSSYDSVTILGDVPGAKPYPAPSFSRPGFLAVRSHVLCYMLLA